MFYTDIRPFFTSASNPFSGLFSSFEVYGLCVPAFVLVAVAYVVRLVHPWLSLDA